MSDTIFIGLGAGTLVVLVAYARTRQCLRVRRD